MVSVSRDPLALLPPPSPAPGPTQLLSTPWLPRLSERNKRSFEWYKKDSPERKVMPAQNQLKKKYMEKGGRIYTQYDKPDEEAVYTKPNLTFNVAKWPLIIRSVTIAVHGHVVVNTLSKVAWLVSLTTVYATICHTLGGVKCRTCYSAIRQGVLHICDAADVRSVADRLFPSSCNDTNAFDCRHFIKSK